jgi:predicted TIM-barrel fold metal-dependent hydrolase
MRFTVGGALFLSSATLPLAAQSGVSFIDAHVHLNDPEGWIRLMDSTGVDRAVVFRGRTTDNQGLAAAAERWPGRLIPFLSVSPEHREYRGAWERDDPSILGVVDSLLATGAFEGIGEISVSHFPGDGFPEADFDPGGRVVSGILALAQRYGVPVTVHVEITRLREFESLLEAFPDVSVIWAHGGYTPLFLAERLLIRHPNLVYELSARTWRRHPRSPDYTILADSETVWPEWLALIERFPRRFVVGTDAALRSPERDRRKIESVQRFLLQLTPETRARVARRNLLHLVGLD